MAPPVGNPVLRALDKAKTQTYHFKAIVIAGMGIFTDSYDLFVVGQLNKLIGRIYYYDPAHPTTVGSLPVGVNAAIVGTALVGTLAGQLFFGRAGDKWGRKKVYGITLAVMVVASLGQGVSLGRTATSVIATLCFFRFWLGFGIGGDYPLSATIMSEYSNSKTRGAFVAAVFAMQGFGSLAGAAMTLVFAAIFKAAYPRPGFLDPSVAGTNNSTAPAADWVWRLVFMFGAIPAALTYHARSQMPETARYTALVERDQQQAILDMEKVLQTHFSSVDIPKVTEAETKSTEYGLFSRKFARRHGLELFGTCMAWFLLDVSYYSQTLFQSNLFSAVRWIPADKDMSALEETYRIARAQALFALMSAVPGYWFTVAFIDKVGRKPIQLLGFFMMSAFMYVIAFDFYNLRGIVAGDKGNKSGRSHGGNKTAFLILYAFVFFFFNFGPNTTTFIIPAELFPARLRSTCNGVSSATGKAGATLGTFGFLWASQDKKLGHQAGYKNGIGYKNSFILLALCSTLGFVVTLFCISETKGRALEDLSGEDEDNNALMDGGGPGKSRDSNSTYE